MKIINDKIIDKYSVIINGRVVKENLTLEAAMKMVSKHAYEIVIAKEVYKNLKEILNLFLEKIPKRVKSRSN